MAKYRSGLNNRNLYLAVLEAEVQYHMVADLAPGESSHPGLRWLPSCWVFVWQREGSSPLGKVAQMVKYPLAVQETQVRSLSGEDPLEKGVATHSSIFHGEFHGQRSLAGYSPQDWHDWVTLSFSPIRRLPLSFPRLTPIIPSYWGLGKLGIREILSLGRTQTFIP